ncbi:tetratricopeptide repeat protein [Virgibacillus doumboii]|uniref:tetratricopeptide repeat protein n=1 Tax=Virgibacillus doumboii TaxID=2697503 RepID=UPI0013DEC837|nr:hypothetical protein [Virgibacillus doumboii]
MQHREKNTYEEQGNILPYIPEGDFYFTKGVEAFQKRKFEAAIKWLRKAIEMAPKNPLYQCQMSIIYTELGAYHTANQLLTRVLQSAGGQYPDCYYLLANNYAHLGLLNDAKKYAKSYLDNEPDGDFRGDAEHLLDLIDFDEDDSDDWELESEDELLMYQETVFYYMDNEEWDKALVLLEEMITLFPERKATKHDYTQALFFSGFEDDAIEMEQGILEEQPNSFYSHINLATFYYESDRTEEYERHIQGLLNVYPIHGEQKLRLAVTLARTGLYEEAYIRFRKLPKATVKNHLSYFKWYSVTAYKLGNPAKALSLWEEGCKKHPNLSKEEGPWDV